MRVPTAQFVVCLEAQMAGFGGLFRRISAVWPRLLLRLFSKPLKLAWKARSRPLWRSFATTKGSCLQGNICWICFRRWRCLRAAPRTLCEPRWFWRDWTRLILAERRAIGRARRCGGYSFAGRRRPTRPQISG